jgi:hypothetical protein
VSQIKKAIIFKKPTLNSFFVILLFVITLSNFFIGDDNKSFLNYSLIVSAIILFIYNLNLKTNIRIFFNIYFQLFIIFGFNLFFTSYFDYKNFVIYLSYLFPSIVIYYFLSSITNISFFINIFKSIFIFLFLILIINTFYTGSYVLFDLNNFYLNGWFQINFLTFGINKLEQGQILFINFLIALFSNFKYKYLFILIILFLLIGSRSSFVATGFFLFIYFFNSKRISFTTFFLTTIIIFGTPLFFINTPDSLYFELDIRSSNQIVGISTFFTHIFGVGFCGWNEYATANQSFLMFQFGKYQPILELVGNSGIVSTTLESSFFQLLGEIGILTFILYFFLFKIFISGLNFKIKNELNLFKSINLIYLVASFFEDILFTPIWWLFFAMFIGLTNREYMINNSNRDKFKSLGTE